MMNEYGPGSSLVLRLDLQMSHLRGLAKDSRLSSPAAGYWQVGGTLDS